MNLNLASFKNCNPKFKWVLLFLVGFICVIVAISLYASKNNPQQSIDYGIVIAISESHTRITPFKWSNVKLDNTALVTTEDSCRIDVGVSERTTNISAVYSGFLGCLNEASSKIPTDMQMNTLIYPILTDGFRLLNRKNAGLASQMMEDLFHQLSSYSYSNIKFTVSYPIKLSGIEEGAYSWIQLNYILKFIPTKSSKPETVGVLRMGDASSQMAFATEAKSANDAIEVFGKQWTLRVDSNQCYGADEIAKRYFLFIIKTIAQQKEVFNVPDPCSNQGMIRHINGSDLMENECIQTKDQPIDKFIKANATYTFTGNGNMQTCKLILNQMLDFNECAKSFRYCYVSQGTAWREDKDFYAIDKYYNVTRVLPTLSRHASTTYTQFALETTAFCLLNWDAVTSSHPNVSPNACFLLNFIEQSFPVMYNIKDQEWSDVQFVERLNGNELDWSLGFMLSQSNSYPNIMPSTRNLGLGGFLFLLILASCMVAYASMKLCGSLQIGQTNAKQPSGEYEII